MRDRFSYTCSVSVSQRSLGCPFRHTNQHSKHSRGSAKKTNLEGERKKAHLELWLSLKCGCAISRYIYSEALSLMQARDGSPSSRFFPPQRGGPRVQRGFAPSLMTPPITPHPPLTITYLLPHFIFMSPTRGEGFIGNVLLCVINCRYLHNPSKLVAITVAK